MDLSPLTIAILTLVALVAGLIDAIAGGGGLLTVPALLSTNIDTAYVLGTNKGNAVFGSGSALARFWHAKLIDRTRAPALFALGFFGAIGGASLATIIDPKILRPVALVLLVAAGITVAFVRPRPVEGATPSPGASTKMLILALVIGTYDGFFGPGTGTFLIIGFVMLLRFSMQEASANAKVVNFASNLGALVVFAFRGLVIWKVSIPMAVGQLIGGIIGAQLAVKRGDHLVKRVVLVVVIGLVARLTYQLVTGG
ncbi:MAG: TSUP family transporter [Archangium sp.]|nr:TSUP family transporter [Archangium sp.]